MILPDFTRNLLKWHKKNGRTDLPWQKNKTTYRVWISEIMLQQTQVKTVVPYYLKFMQFFPDIATLANAPLDTVLTLWSGLGYYARARNLHKTSKIIQRQYHGKFPSNVNQLTTLPGIGCSTASAMLAFSEKQALPILDGNVKRVLARLHAIVGWPGKSSVEQQLWQIAKSYTPDSRNIVAYTQAIMDLGATICIRSSPKCDQCPVTQQCLALAKNEVAAYPYKAPKKTLVTKHSFFILLTNQKNEILLERRPEIGIWGGLWSLPEATTIEVPRAYHYHLTSIDLKTIKKFAPIKHSFTHFILIATPIQYTVTSASTIAMSNTQVLWHNPCDVLPKGVPAPIKKLLLHLARE